MNAGAAPVILLTGATGQVGFELVRALQGVGRIAAPGRDQCDFRGIDAVRRVVRELGPALIINAAAYTAVDAAETEPELAMRINGEAVGVLAEEARRLNAPLIHYSTDYVFDGAKLGPYLEADAPCPANAYGRSKLAGEQAIAQVGCINVILRTSWIYSLHRPNFLLRTLAQARAGGVLRMATDQLGSPTWSRTVAALSAHLVLSGMSQGVVRTDWWQERAGLYHLSASGVASRYDFAEAILALTPQCRHATLVPASLADFDLPARRPTNCQLATRKFVDAFGVVPLAWRDALRQCLGERDGQAV